jgi:hypothetical protein
MNADKVNRWLTLGANIGVVIGLMLVAVQINQDADLTRAQLFSEATDSRREFNQGMMGSDPMRVVTKSIERPHELTLEELQIMDMYLIAAVNEVRRLELLQDTGLAADVDVEALEYFYFGSKFEIKGSEASIRILLLTISSECSIDLAMNQVSQLHVIREITNENRKTRYRGNVSSWWEE